jgi:hypothetical protein
MDPRERADVTLARARARGAFVVTPESAISPMDAASTLQIPRAVVTANDERRQDDPDATLVVPIAEVQRRAGLPAQEPRSEENIPAIAQEALTGMVSAPPPGMRSRQRRIEDARARAMAARQNRPEPEAPAEAGEPENLFQANQHAPTSSGSLSQRLDG